MSVSKRLHISCFNDEETKQSFIKSDHVDLISQLFHMTNTISHRAAVVKSPPNNLWIIAAVLAPIGVVTLIIIIITTVLCHKNKSDFKSDPIGSFNPRMKVQWRLHQSHYNSLQYFINSAHCTVAALMLVFKLSHAVLALPLGMHPERCGND